MLVNFDFDFDFVQNFSKLYLMINYDGFSKQVNLWQGETFAIKLSSIPKKGGVTMFSINLPRLYRTHNISFVLSFNLLLCLELLNYI